MKRLIHLLVGIVSVAAVAASPAVAQKSQSIEFAGFGSYWRFDHLYFLKNSIGGGARIAYAWSDRLSLEVAGDFTKTVDTASALNVSVSSVSGNLIFNFPMGDKATLYATGGVSRLVFGTQAPYKFTDNMLNGGLGARVFLSQHLALRLDARAMYNRKNRDPLNPTRAVAGRVRSKAEQASPISSFRLSKAAASTGSINGTGARRAAPSSPERTCRRTSMIRSSAGTG